MQWTSRLPPFFEMPASSDHQHYVRRVVLPSGKTIEVVYFEDLSVPTEAITTHEAPAELHVCPACSGRLVFPVDWEEAGPAHWEVDLRCPDCGWEHTGVYPQETVDRFDAQLDRGAEAVVRDLKCLMHANMEEEIDRFVRALHTGLIVPEDF